MARRWRYQWAGGCEDAASQRGTILRMASRDERKPSTLRGVLSQAVCWWGAEEQRGGWAITPQPSRASFPHQDLKPWFSKKDQLLCLVRGGTGHKLECERFPLAVRTTSTFKCIQKAGANVYNIPLRLHARGISHNSSNLMNPSCISLKKSSN